MTFRDLAGKAMQKFPSLGFQFLQPEKFDDAENTKNHWMIYHND